MAILSAIGITILIIIGVLLVALLSYALRILIAIYKFFVTKEKQVERKVSDAAKHEGSALVRLVKDATVIELILLLLKNRGKFKR
jgi:hypothetical protein